MFLFIRRREVFCSIKKFPPGAVCSERVFFVIPVKKREQNKIEYNANHKIVKFRYNIL